MTDVSAKGMPADNKFLFWALITLIPTGVSIIISVVTLTLQFGTRIARIEVGLEAQAERLHRESKIVEAYYNDMQVEIKSLRGSVSNSREYVRRETNKVRDEFNSAVLRHLNNTDIHSRSIKLEQTR